MAIRNLSLWAVVSVCLIAGAIGWAIQSQKMQSMEAARKAVYYEKAVALGVSIEKVLVEAVEVSMSLRGVLSQSHNISQDRFEELAKELRRDRDYILNIAYAPGMVTEYVHPLAGNESVLGFDIRTRPDQWSVARTAAEVGKPVVAGPVALVQGGHGFIVRVPVYDGNGVGMEYLTGIISTVVSTQPVSHLVAETGQDFAFVAIRGRDGLSSAEKLILGPSHVFEHDPVLYDISLPFGHWQIGIHLDVPWNQLPTITLVSLWTAILAMCVCGTVIFLTALRFQDSKERAEHDLAAAIESIKDGFAMFDPDDRLIMCNAVYADIYDLPQNLQETGTRFEDILKYGLDRGQYPEADGREIEWLKERLELHRNPTGSFNQLLTDGRWIKIAESKTSNGSIVGFRVDITELKMAQEAAVRANQIKSQFLNNINHEMRTPLTIMLGYAPILCDIRRLPSFELLAGRLKVVDTNRAVTPLLDGLVEDVSELSAKMQSSGRHLLNLINDTLDLSKIEAGEMKIDPQPVALSPLIEGLIQEFSSKLQDKNVVMRSAENDFVVLADELRLRQILFNLIGNSIKFTQRGLILIYTKKRNTGLEIIVSDTGCGIPARHLSKIFDEFYQGDASTTRNFGGSGLGLAISRNLAILQGGQLKAESVEGRGSRFSITLPLWEACGIKGSHARQEQLLTDLTTEQNVSSTQGIAAE